jgi:outer membrane protein TolC
LGLQFNLPIFDRNRGGIAAAQEARLRAREQYGATLLRSAHEEAEARDELAAAGRLLQIHEAGALRDAELARQSLNTRLRTGNASVLEVLAAHRAIARSRVRALELEERIAIARLRAAVAGGFALQRPVVAGTGETNK